MNSEQAADLTESILSLQKTIETFQEDISNGRKEFIVVPIEDDAINATFQHITRLTSPTPEHKKRLDDLSNRLKSLQTQLQNRSQWLPPPNPQPTPLPTILDFADLTTAIDLLTHIITSTHPFRRLTPHPSFSKFTWTWDPEWKEFYTYLPASELYIYLSRWKFNPQRNVWEHVHMAFGNVGPEDAVELLGAWEDWRWDEGWGEWCLDVREGDGVEGDEGNEGQGRCCVFPSRWEVSGDGNWMYVGRMGGTWN
ncbi:hypothetical protein NX059_008644 [Plenodomus lindquistii]|nr:hypothetical protein NX059_008644 [Plenodomus lindquistii]